MRPDQNTIGNMLVCHRCAICGTWQERSLSAGMAKWYEGNLDAWHCAWHHNEMLAKQRRKGWRRGKRQTGD